MTTKPKDFTKEKDTEKKSFDNQFEVIGEIVSLGSKSLKSNISSDYLMAKFNDAAKEYIPENYQNAEFAMDLMKRFSEAKVYKWDKEKNDWVKDEEGAYMAMDLEDDEKRLILERCHKLFESFMIQPHLMSILNRNRDDNFIIKLIGNKQEEEPPIQYGIDDRNALQKLADKFKGTEEEVVED